MQTELNLLPWRQEQHQKRSKIGLISAAIFLLLALSCHWFLRQFGQDYAQQYQGLQQEQQQLSATLSQTELQLKQLRHSLQQHQTAVEIPQDLITPMFGLLDQLPLKQGELSQLQFSAQQLLLAGNAADHEEFEQLHQFLKQAPQITSLKLSQFAPQSEGNLHFEFQLQLKHSEGHNAANSE